MEYIGITLVALVAIEHVYILVLEMFLWTTPRAMRVFAMTPELAEKTKAMAANQGLYNGFLAAGLFWGLFLTLMHNDETFGIQIQVFFLSCIIIASLYGAATVKKTILLVQGLPALLALLSIVLL